ncbi:hypothetical protein HT031_005046 [Scenedesmus sp. PABB004]|nr:hypothetical protein HT031_005046 [Scenedesmus sp. PABB004]
MVPDELLERQAPSMRAPRVLQRPGVTCAALKRLLDLATIGAGAYLGKRARLGAGGENPKTHAELLLGFFTFCGAQMAAWAAGQEGTRASAWWGRWVSAPWGAKRYIFSIEDPFNAVDNTARSVGTHNSLANATTAGYIAWVTSSSEARMRAALDAASGGDAASDVLAAYAWLFGPSAVLRLPRLPAPLAGALAAAVPDEDARESHAAADAALGGATAALSLSSCLVNATNNGSSSDPAKVQRVRDALELFRRLVASLGDGGSWPVCLGDYTARQRERAAAARRQLEEQAADGSAAGLAAAVDELHVGSAPARPAAWPPHRQQQQGARVPRPAQARRQPHQQQLGGGAAGGGDGGARGRSRSTGGAAAHGHDPQAAAAVVMAALSALPDHPPDGSAPRAVPAGRGRAGRHSSGGGADPGAALFSSSAPLPRRPRRGQAAAAGDGGAQPGDGVAAPQQHHSGAVQASVAGTGGGPLLSAALKDALHAANGGSAGGDGGGRRPSSRQRASKHRRQIGLSLAQWKKAARALRLDLPEQLLAGVTVLCVLNACLLALHGLGLGDEQLATFSRPACPEHIQPCPKCGTVIANGATKCPDCKHDMVKEKRKEQRRQHAEQLAEDMGIQLLLAGLDGVEDAQLPRWGNRKSESNICKDAMARFDTTLALFDVSIHTRIVVLSKKADTWDEHTPLFTTTGESVALVSDLAIPQFGYESKTRRVYVVSFVGIGPGAYSHLKQLPGYAEIVKAQVALSQRAAQVHLQFLEASAGGGGEGGSGEADDGQRGEESAPRAEAAAPDRPPATAAGTGSMDVDGYMMMHAPPGPDVPRTHRPVQRFIEERDDALLGQLSVLGQEEKWSGIMVFRSVRRGLQELPQVVEVDRGVYERDARSACVLLSHAETECLSKGGIAGVVVSTTYLDVVVRTISSQLKLYTAHVDVVMFVFDDSVDGAEHFMAMRARLFCPGDRCGAGDQAVRCEALVLDSLSASTCYESAAHDKARLVLDWLRARALLGLDASSTIDYHAAGVQPAGNNWACGMFAAWFMWLFCQGKDPRHIDAADMLHRAMSWGEDTLELLRAELRAEAPSGAAAAPEAELEVAHTSSLGGSGEHKAPVSWGQYGLASDGLELGPPVAGQGEEAESQGTWPNSQEPSEADQADLTWTPGLTAKCAEAKRQRRVEPPGANMPQPPPFPAGAGAAFLAFQATGVPQQRAEEQRARGRRGGR